MKNILAKKRTSADGATAELIKKQCERIEELRSENSALTKSVEDYRKREKEIADTLDFARKKSEEYVAMARVKYALECERVKRFREKLEKFRSRDELIAGYDNAFSELRELQEEMERAIAEDLGGAMTDYLSERKRINDDPRLDYGAIIDSAETDLEASNKISEDDLKDLLEQL
jgi:predicted RNase H-like nuclease (RuvC/YqgF family)